MATKPFSKRATGTRDKNLSSCQGLQTLTKDSGVVKQPKRTPARKEKSARQSGRKLVIPGFKHWSEPIPNGLQHEDIIKIYPNHLWGALLLEIAATWSPKEISVMSGRPELKANTLVKRIQTAKLQRDRLLEMPARTAAALKKASRQKPDTPVTEQSQPIDPASNIESEESLRFRTEQQDLHDIIMKLDPTWIERQANGRGRKNPELDRTLVLMAVAERERRMKLV